MSIQPIRLLGDPVLRRPCARVKTFATDELRTLIGDLTDTLSDFRTSRGFGRGIAAPQIGVPLRVIVTKSDAPPVLINPSITRRSRKKVTLWDDCFSFPDLAVRLKRHLAIDVSYADEEGKQKSFTATGAAAELLQHEIDHLDGVLAIDRAIDLKHIVYKMELEKSGETGKPLAM
jgi:peptide deformylase